MSLAMTVLLLHGLAGAASRLVVTMEQSASLVLDGQVHPPAVAGQRVTVSHISVGVHTLEVRDPAGELLYTASIDIPDGATVQARWSPASGLTYEGPSAALPPPVHTTPSNNPYANLGAGSVTVPGTIAGASTSSTTIVGTASEPAPAGDSDGLQTTNPLVLASGQIAKNIAYSAVPGGDIARSLEGSALGSATGEAIRSRTSRSQGSTKQIIKPDPEAVLGEVIFFSRSAATMDIYVDGMYRGMLEAGELNRSMRIEIGQRQIEFWVADQPRFKGELQVDQSVPVQLELSDVSTPKSLNRSWAWADRY